MMGAKTMSDFEKDLALSNVLAPTSNIATLSNWPFDDDLRASPLRMFLHHHCIGASGDRRSRKYTCGRAEWEVWRISARSYMDLNRKFGRDPVKRRRGERVAVHRGLIESR
jgi:hypothetical protein